MRNKTTICRSVLTLFMLTLLLALTTLNRCSCSEDEKGNPGGPTSTETIIAGRILNQADSSGIADANIVIYNANTNAPITRTTSAADGTFLLHVDVGGTYYFKVAAQGYLPSPPKYGMPLPFQVVQNDTTRKVVFLSRDSEAVAVGSMYGTISLAGSQVPVSGALVVALLPADSSTMTSVSGPDGYYVIFNMAPGTYSLHCYLAGYRQVTGVDSAVTISVNIATGPIDIAMSDTVLGKLTGRVTFLASQNSRVDITLVHPIAREAVPGLYTFNDTTGNTYQLTEIPPGTYIVWASYRNDGYVMDPDWIYKSGLPYVTFSPGDTGKQQDFSVTDAIEIVSPTNPPDSVSPVLVTTGNPMFVWHAYPSTHEYIVEVFNSDGERIWGGFNVDGTINHPQISSHQDSVVFNFDGSASDTLRPGETYRWKVYADDDASANVQTLISSSEDQLGLFKRVTGITGKR